jgi:transcriptional regulator with XRE-family HTH domain
MNIFIKSTNFGKNLLIAYHIIKELRIDRGLTQENLSEGICFKQHIYRLEKNKRLPSAYLVNLLAEKLGTELIESIYYSECKW